PGGRPRRRLQLRRHRAAGGDHRDLRGRMAGQGQAGRQGRRRRGHRQRRPRPEDHHRREGSLNAMRLHIVRSILMAVALAAAASTLHAAEPKGPSPLVPQGAAPVATFNRLHTYEEVVALLKAYAAAYPKWTRLESVGKSIQGRDLWMITVTNPATGPELGKPAMYIDANTHAHEVQGAEPALYTVDFLLKNYGVLPRVTEMLDRSVFYVLPVVNPDGRALWFSGPSNADYPRTVMVPRDDDRDGKVDEDGPDDLDGDGFITTMRKKVPLGQGTHKLDTKDSRLL